MNGNGIKITKKIIRALTAVSFLFFVAYQLFLVTKIEEGRTGRIIGVFLYSLITLASFLALTSNSAVRIARIILFTVGLGGNFLVKLVNIPVYFGTLDFSYIPSVLRCAIYIFSQLGTLLILVYYLAIRRNQTILPSTKRKAANVMMSVVIVLFVLCLIMELVMMLRFGESITYSLSTTIISRFLYCFGFAGIAVGFMLPSTTVEEDDLEEYVNKEQADADIMVISPENQKPRAEEERRRNLVIDNADIVMNSPENKKPRAEEERRRNLVIDNADIVMGAPENKKPRAEEERRRNLVIDNADIVMGSPETKKSHSNKNKPRKSVLDDNDFVFSTTENTRSSKNHKK